jgi:hypothetical protein
MNKISLLNDSLVQYLNNNKSLFAADNRIPEVIPYLIIDAMPDKYPCIYVDTPTITGYEPVSDDTGLFTIDFPIEICDKSHPNENNEKQSEMRVEDICRNLISVLRKWDTGYVGIKRFSFSEMQEIGNKIKNKTLTINLTARMACE